MRIATMSAMGENSQVRTATRGEGLVKPRKPKTNIRRREETRPRGEEPNLLLEPSKAGHAGNREKLMITSGGGGGNGGGGKLLGKSEGDDFVPPPRHPEWVTSGHLVRRFMVEGGAGKNLEEAQGAARSGEAIVLAGSGIAKRELSRRWTFDYLMCSAGAPPGLEVLCSMDGKNRFTSVERENNAYGSYYFVREPETIALDDQTSLADFVECARGWRGKHVCATAVVMQRKGEAQARGGDDEDGGAMVLTEAELAEIRARLVDPAVLPAPAPGLGATLARDLANLLAWDRLASFLTSQSLGSVGSVRLRLGTTNGLHPLRYDLSDRIVVQVRGRSRYLVVGPEFALRGLYPYPTHHPYDRYSMVDLEQDEAEIEEHWPLFRQNARGREVVLREGECLFLPRYQFAQRQDLDPETVSLEMEVAKGMRTRHENAVPLQVSSNSKKKKRHEEVCRTRRTSPRPPANPCGTDPSTLNLSACSHAVHGSVPTSIRSPGCLSAGSPRWRA